MKETRETLERCVWTLFYFSCDQWYDRLKWLTTRGTTGLIIRLVERTVIGTWTVCFDMLSHDTMLTWKCVYVPGTEIYRDLKCSRRLEEKK